MKGGYVHDQVLLQGVAAAFKQAGASLRYQAPSSAGYCDLTARLPDGRLFAVEIEMTTRRIENDLRKGAEIKADELWIVVPNQQVLRASKRRLQQLASRSEVAVFILTLPQALKRLSDSFPMPM